MLTVDVTSQVDLALKRPVQTDVTGERLEAGVFATVSDEVGRLTERLAALSTRVRLLACTIRHKYRVGQKNRTVF